MRRKLEQFFSARPKANNRSEQSEQREQADTKQHKSQEDGQSETSIVEEQSSETIVAADVGVGADMETENTLSGEDQATVGQNGRSVDTNELPPLETTLLEAIPRLEVASRCHLGMIRRRNEDALYTFIAQTGGYQPLPLFGLFIVADGMGGESDGHKASKIVSRTVAKHVLEKLYRPLLHENNGHVQHPVQEVLEEAVAIANKAVAVSDPELVMGSTLTAALVLASRLFVVHVGDSRAYLWHDNELTLITTDHSVVQALQDAGEITAEEAAIHPKRGVLYRAVTGEDFDELETFTRILPEKGTLLLCSDGLWGMISEAQIRFVLNHDMPLQEKADQLLQAALLGGGNDNITVILVDFVL